jgi:hypothetical protein
VSFAGTCPAKDHDHVVVQRNGNASAFNGYHWTRSDYSSIRCLQTLAFWRTKANYVGALRDATDQEANDPHETPQRRAYLAEHGSTRMTIRHEPEGKTTEWSRE